MEDANRGATAAAAASDEFAMSIGEISQQAANSAEMARKATVSTKKRTPPFRTLRIPPRKWDRSSN